MADNDTPGTHVPGTTDLDVPDHMWAAYVEDLPAPTAGTAPAAPAATPDPAPVPAQAPTAAADTQDPADGEDPEAASDGDLIAQREFFARRRRRYTTLVVVLAAAFAWFLGDHVFATTPATTSASPQVQTGLDPAAPATPALVTTDLATATGVLTNEGDLGGLHLPGARVASAGTTMYASRLVGGVCWAYGIIDGHPAAARVDATGQVCTDTAIAATQQKLDAVHATAQQRSRQDAVTALQQATALVGYYGSRNMVAGVPNVAGLVLPDKTVVASNNTGDHVRLTTTLGGVCETVVAAADGTAGLPQACS